MKNFLADFLICPACLPKEIGLNLEVNESEDEDVTSGFLICKKCRLKYRIEDGVAVLTPYPDWQPDIKNKYENPRVVFSYLWSHYGDLLGDRDWLPAYPNWSKLMSKNKGYSLDIGCAVGRFTFEMTGKSDYSIGFDLSFEFIKTARELMKKRGLTFELTEEGYITSTAQIRLPDNVNTKNVEFFVADALNVPFPKSFFTKVASLNILDKVPNPMKHLKEMNRVCRDKDAEILISDPFSWSEEVASVSEWLGGKNEGDFSGFGHDNVARILEGYGEHIIPPWKIIERGKVDWKIRNHRNHSELIKSLYIKAIR